MTNNSEMPIHIVGVFFECLGNPQIEVAKTIDALSSKTIFITQLTPCDGSLFVKTKFKDEVVSLNCGYASSGIPFFEETHIIELNKEISQLICNGGHESTGIIKFLNR